MTFTNPLDTSPTAPRSQLVASDPMHDFISAPSATITGATLSVVLNPSMLMDGLYTVSFRAWAPDGFASQGTWYFHVDGTLADGRDTSLATIPIPTSGTTSLAFMAKGSGIPDHAGSDQGVAMGTFDIDFVRGTLCYSITTRGLQGITAGHVHSANAAAMTISDEISIPIDLAAINATSPVCSRPSPQSLAYLAHDPSRYVLMLHTQDYPDGAVAGTFLLVSSTATFSTAQSGPPWWAVISGQSAIVLAVVALLLAIRRRSRVRARRTIGETGEMAASSGSADARGPNGDFARDGAS